MSLPRIAGRILFLLEDVKFFLEGKKTYIAGGLMVLHGIAEEKPELILEGLAVAFLRAGISKS